MIVFCFRCFDGVDQQDDHMGSQLHNICIRIHGLIIATGKGELFGVFRLMICPHCLVNLHLILLTCTVSLLCEAQIWAASIQNQYFHHHTGPNTYPVTNIFALLPSLQQGPINSSCLPPPTAIDHATLVLQSQPSHHKIHNTDSNTSCSSLTGIPCSRQCRFSF